MLVLKHDILKYIPQRPPFVMIDCLIEATNLKIVSGFTVPDKNVLIENGFFNESGIIENIAQTAAAGIGYKQTINNTPISLGYIAAIKSLLIYELPKVGTSLITTIEVINEVIDITIVNALVVCNNIKMAECEMRIYVKPQ